MARREELQLLTPELKAFDCVEHDPIDLWVPEEECVFYQLTLHIGPSGSDACDLYRTTVATPRGLTDAKQAGARLGPQSPVIVEPYSWSAVLMEVHRRLESCRAYGWLDVQEKLRRQFAWEYEGMS